MFHVEHERLKSASFYEHCCSIVEKYVDNFADSYQEPEFFYQQNFL